MSVTADTAGAAHAYTQVRAAIVENRYPPGHRLVEQRIAEELGLSRTPVREALRMLEAEGLVVSERNRGAIPAEEFAKLLTTFDGASLLRGRARTPPGDARKYKNKMGGRK